MNEKKSINYIEPNLIHKITDENGNVFEQTPDLEDYCITVNIGVTLYNRKSGVKVTEGLKPTRYLLSWNGYEGSVNFMQGSKVYYDNQKSDYINSLTTDYADFYYDDLVKNSDQLATTEMFGIESIEINYDNYYVPQVTVKFIDIRGMSLFMPEELRHNISSNGIDGSINQDIAGSFFKSFFSFPYPKFDMMIKGFYGKPVTFELSIVDWRANFDCSRGSFGCTVNFIGYSYALLSDITLNALLAAPESDYVGKQYWKSQVANGNFVFDDNTPIVSFRELLDRYATYASEKEKISANSPKNKELENLRQKNDLLQKINQEYLNFINDLKQLSLNYKDKVILKLNDSFVYCIIGDKTSNVEIMKQTRETALQLERTLNNYNNLFSSDDLPKLDFSDFLTEKTNGTAVVNLAERILDTSLIKEIQQRAKDKNFKYVYCFDSKNFRDSLKTKQDKVRQKMDFLSQSLQNEYQQLSNKVLGFENTLANFVKMICAHIDTLLTMIYTCADKANNDTTRTLDKFLNLAVQDVQFTNEKDKYMPAFPQVGIRNYIGNVDKVEMAWIEDVYPYAEEVNLVKGLLNGSELITEQVSETNEVLSDIKNKTNTNNNIQSQYIPTLPFDYIDSRNPFGTSKINYSLLDDVFARIYMRGFIAAYSFPFYGKQSSVMSTIGEIDAINFHKAFNKPSKTFIDLIINSKNATEFINYKPSERATYSWGKESLLVKNQYNYDLTDKFFIKDNNVILPIRNYDYQNAQSKINEDLNLLKEDNLIYQFNDKLQENGYTNYEFFIIKDNILNKINNWNIIFPNENDIATINNIKELYEIPFSDYNDFINEYYDESFSFSSAEEHLSEFLVELKSDKEGTFQFSTPSIFGDYRYYNCKTMSDKAFFFLDKLYNDKVDDTLKFLKSNNKAAYCVPKLLLMYLGGLIKYNKILASEYLNRKAKIDLVNEFDNWVYNTYDGFAKIDSELALDDITLKTIRIDKSNKTSIEFTNANYITPKYSDIHHGEKFRVGLKLIKEKEIYTILYKLATEQVIMFQSTFKYYPLKNSETKIKKSVYSQYLNLYMNGFIKKLKQIYKDEQLQNNTPTQSQVSDTGTDKNFYISLYNYLKLTYDRWLGGKNDNERSIWMLNELYKRFHFIDSFYFNIGNEIHIDINQVVELINNSLRQDTISIVEFLTNILAKQNMIFLSIQNFLDLSKKENIETMFIPIPYCEIGEVIPQTDFICLYTYKTSNNLNIDDSEYMDDSFLLSDPNIGETMPFLVVNDKDTGYDIPCFGVTYGKQYQSYFTSVNPSMENPVVTEQVIKSQFLLANSAPNGSAKELFVGQDLYSIYSNNSYTCTVEMLGCAWVQPLMYFALLNIPMFRGSYLIFKVSHSIQQGRMITTFTGSRMCKVCTPLISNTIVTLSNKENGKINPQKVLNNNVASNENNCLYPKFAPETHSLEGYKDIIQKSCENTPSINQKMNIEIVSNSQNSLIIKCENKKLLTNVYDMILYTYYEFITQLFWVIENENHLLNENPYYIYLSINADVVCVDKRIIGLTDKKYKMLNLTIDSSPQSLLKTLSKCYNSERKFITECYNFKNDKMTYQKLKTKFTFNCNSMNLSNDEIKEIQKSRNLGQPDVNSLPNEISFPINQLKGLNLSGYFGESRSGHLHQGIDIGTGGNGQDGSYKMLSIYDGVIVNIQKSTDYGDIITIRHSIRNLDGEYLYTRYLHGFINKEKPIEINQIIRKGEEIGTVAGRGVLTNRYAIHLHLEFAFFKGEYTRAKFHNNVVDPQSYYYFGKYKNIITENIVQNGNIRKLGNDTPLYTEMHP